MQANRTFLFAPGNHPSKLEKVFKTGADAVILDLEDAVAQSEKVATRSLVVKALQLPRCCRGYVRVNALETEFAFEDIQAIVTEGVDGIVLPKVECASDIQMIDWIVSNLERQCHLPVGKIDLMPIIETGRGLANVREICGAGGRMRRVSFGAGDYTRDMAMDWTKDENELAHARAEIALASRLGNLEPPIDTVFIYIREADAFRASATQARSFGYQGKLCIHPNQVLLANTVFSPTDEEVSWSREVITAFTEAEASGSASIQIDGHFVDYPIFKKAERIVHLSEAIRASKEP
ncbi:MAG: HpcH/HpaI aldolase/citrate lyase family protein [Hyphomicrobiaceae bacterium]